MLLLFPFYLSFIQRLKTDFKFWLLSDSCNLNIYVCYKYFAIKLYQDFAALKGLKVYIDLQLK